MNLCSLCINTIFLSLLINPILVILIFNFFDKLVILVLFLSILFPQHHDHGHNHIHGKISGLLLNDATGLPVEYATISIFKSNQNSLMVENSAVTGGISNEDGYFNIDEIEPGKYRVVIKFTGYEIVELEDIKLIPYNQFYSFTCNNNVYGFNIHYIEMI